MDNVESPENFEPDYGKYCLNSKGLNSLYLPDVSPDKKMLS